MALRLGRSFGHTLCREKITIAQPLNINTKSLCPVTTSVSPVLPQLGGVRNYPGGGRLKIIKRRRKTVNTIGKLTKTMSVVASSKMVPAQQKATEVSPFFNSMTKTFASIAKQPKDGDKVLTVVISTDKGLCGATNNGLTRALLKQDLSNHGIVVWGDKGCGAFERSNFKQNVLFSAHPNQKSTLSFIEVSTFAERLIKLDFDFFRIAYNKMVTATSPDIDYLYIPSPKKLLSEEGKNVLSQYEIEANAPEEFVVNIAEFLTSAAINYACFQNQAVEIFARRNSMDNATKNAKEVGSKLNIKFNRERQAMITTELGEITSGAAAVDEMTAK